VSQVWGGDSFLLVTDLAVGEPAITTNGKPIAGPGVSRALLGRVYRKGVGWQVTYAGHPLYLFDQGPGQVTGEGWFEPGLPPWHGIWWLMSPGGNSCWANASCARAWPPVRTDGAPSWSGVSGNAIGEIGTPSGLQVTWYGHPLYLFSNEQLMPTANGGAVAVGNGNGNGITAFGGTFNLVNP
jgi:predicted lipoprotein with Yx(FWY)xxD motif